MSAPVLHFTRFGKYEIIRKLGRGMTDVYLALDPDASRRVVLKIVEQCRDQCTQAVLDAERRGAMIQQQLHAIDSRILEVYECGEQDGCFFIAMEYVEGKSLAEILAREGRLDPTRAARYAAEVLSQLTTLHSFQAEIDGQKRAVIHGDIKPSNIQVGVNDEVRLLDFGIAKAITLTRSLTHHNLGSPAYCSPERLRKGQVDPHADLWALGISLYEMVAGLPPYQAQSTRKLENLIQSRRPPRALPEACPPALRAVISKALAADSGRRYSSASAFESDLRLLLAGRRTLAETEKQPPWEVNATVEKGCVPKAESLSFESRVSRYIVEFNRVTWSALAGLAVGLLVFLAASHLYTYWAEAKPLRTGADYARDAPEKIASDWQLYNRLSQQYGFLGRFSPVHQLTQPLRTRLAAAADDVIDRYRNSSDPQLEHFDWHKARTSLSYVIALDGGDPRAAGKLAVCDGYIHLSENGTQPARESFETAAISMPRSPDPHLGLARVYVYGLHNVGLALAEFHTAEKLGFKIGPREFEQQADGYLDRAESEMRAWQSMGSRPEAGRLLALAKRDFERARELYEPIDGFSNVSRSLERIERDEEHIRRVVAARERARQLALRRRWQARYRQWR